VPKDLANSKTFVLETAALSPDVIVTLKAIAPVPGLNTEKSCCPRPCVLVEIDLLTLNTPPFPVPPP